MGATVAVDLGREGVWPAQVDAEPEPAPVPGAVPVPEPGAAPEEERHIRDGFYEVPTD